MVIYHQTGQPAHTLDKCVLLYIASLVALLNVTPYVLLYYANYSLWTLALSRSNLHILFITMHV